MSIHRILNRRTLRLITIVIAIVCLIAILARISWRHLLVRYYIYQFKNSSDLNYASTLYQIANGATPYFGGAYSNLIEFQDISAGHLLQIIEDEKADKELRENALSLLGPKSDKKIIAPLLRLMESHKNAHPDKDELFYHIYDAIENITSHEFKFAYWRCIENNFKISSSEDASKWMELVRTKAAYMNKTKGHFKMVNQMKLWLKTQE